MQVRLAAQETRHLVATAVAAERVSTLGGGDLVLVLQTLKVSTIGKCGGGAVGLLRLQVAVGPHHVQRVVLEVLVLEDHVQLESFFLPSMRKVGRLRDMGAAASGK